MRSMARKTSGSELFSASSRCMAVRTVGGCSSSWYRLPSARRGMGSVANTRRVLEAGACPPWVPSCHGDWRAGSGPSVPHLRVS